MLSNKDTRKRNILRKVINSKWKPFRINVFTRKNNLKNKRPRKSNSDAEVRPIEDKHRRDREQASKDIQASPKMTTSENIYYCVVRVDRIFTTNIIPKDKWAGALGEIFTGNALE